ELLHRALADGDLARADAVLALGGGLDAAGINAVFEALAGDGAGIETLRWLARRGVVADAMPAGGGAMHAGEAGPSPAEPVAAPAAAGAGDPPAPPCRKAAAETQARGDSLLFRLLDRGGAAAAALAVLLERGAD